VVKQNDGLGMLMPHGSRLAYHHAVVLITLV